MISPISTIWYLSLICLPDIYEDQIIKIPENFIMGMRLSLKYGFTNSAESHADPMESQVFGLNLE